MYDTLTFHDDFEPDTEFPVDIHGRTWQAKRFCGAPGNRRFRITADGSLEQKDDEGWIHRLNTETGRFYNSISSDDGETRTYYSFDITFQGGNVTDISLEKEQPVD